MTHCESWMTLVRIPFFQLNQVVNALPVYARGYCIANVTQTMRNKVPVHSWHSGSGIFCVIFQFHFLFFFWGGGNSLERSKEAYFPAKPIHVSTFLQNQHDFTNVLKKCNILQLLSYYFHQITEIQQYSKIWNRLAWNLWSSVVKNLKFCKSISLVNSVLSCQFRRIVLVTDNTENSTPVQKETSLDRLQELNDIFVWQLT